MFNFNQDPKFDLCEYLKAFCPTILVAWALSRIIYLALQQLYRNRTPGYFKRKREYSFEEEFTPKRH